MPGPKILTNIVEVYIFTRSIESQSGLLFLQLRRSRQPMAGSWQPVMGHIEDGETAVQAGLRELMEETQLGPMSDAKSDTASANRSPCVWQLETVNTFFLASLDAILMCPGIAVEVSPHVAQAVVIDDAHDAYRWVNQRDIEQDLPDAQFLWPGQRTAARQIITEIAPHDGRLRRYLRL